MRRSDREITDKSEIIKIIEKCDVCRLGLSEDNTAYIIPMNFGYEYTEDSLTLYFHCAKEGRKLTIINKNPSACFEMDCSHKLIEGEAACDYSMEYESVIGYGNITICCDKDEKCKALKLLMKTYAPDKDFSFSEQQIDAVVVLRLDVNQFTGKRRLN